MSTGKSAGAVKTTTSAKATTIDCTKWYNKARACAGRRRVLHRRERQLLLRLGQQQLPPEDRPRPAKTAAPPVRPRSTRMEPTATQRRRAPARITAALPDGCSQYATGVRCVCNVGFAGGTKGSGQFWASACPPTKTSAFDMIWQILAFVGVVAVALAPRAGLTALRIATMLYGLGVGP
jgi:hypothetical protein